MHILFGFLILGQIVSAKLLVINTWGGPFSNATVAAYSSLSNGGSALDAVEAGGIYCENNQCDTTVGFGNHPDTSGRTSLDAMIMDGANFDAGAVGYLRHHRQAISIARGVMVFTDHTMLVGEGAESFADMLGFDRQEATTMQTREVYDQWQGDNCQPNFYENIPAATTSCGPYNISVRVGEPQPRTKRTWQASRDNHDTIGLVVIDSDNSIACGTSTNGANHKVAGRIGDSPIVGAGCYADNSVGGAAATGDGDVMMRFLPSFHAVSLMAQGISPAQACKQAVLRIANVFPSFAGGVVCVNKYGDFAGAAHGMDFSYSVYSSDMSDVLVVPVEPCCV